MIDGNQLYLSTGAISNFVIAASMLYFARTFSLKVYPLFLKPCIQFISTKRMAAWSKNLDGRITKLIRTAFGTGALCSATAFIDLAIYLHSGHDFVHVAMYA